MVYVRLTVRLMQYTYMKWWCLFVWLYVWFSVPIWSDGVCSSDCTSDAVYLYEVMVSVRLTVRLMQYTYKKWCCLFVWLYVWFSVPIWSDGVCSSDCTSDAVYLYEVMVSVRLTVRLMQYTYMKWWCLFVWLYVWCSIPIWSDGVCSSDCTSDAVYLYEVMVSVRLTVCLMQYTYMKWWCLVVWLYVWCSIPIWSDGVCSSDCTSDVVYLYEVMVSVRLTVRLMQYTYMKWWCMFVWLYVWCSIPIWSDGVCLSDCTSDVVYLYEVHLSIWHSISAWSVDVCPSVSLSLLMQNRHGIVVYLDMGRWVYTDRVCVLK